MRSFEYLAPSTLQDALAALHQRENASVLAGGTDLILRLKRREQSPSTLVDIKRIEELDGLETGVHGLSIGAGVTMSRIEASAVVRQDYAGLHAGAATVGSAQIRNRATVVGNVCNATPCADTVPPLVVLQAQVRMSSQGGERRLPLEQLFTGPGTTVVRPDEIVVSVEVPLPEPGTGSAYARHSTRAAMDLAAAGVAVALTLEDDNETCRRAHIALGAVAPTPIRASQAEDILSGQALTPALVAEAARVASTEARPISDVRASAEFRQEIVRVLAARTIQAAAADAQRRQAMSRRSG